MARFTSGAAASGKTHAKLSVHAVAMIEESDMVGNFSFEEELRKQGDLPDYL